MSKEEMFIAIQLMKDSADMIENHMARERRVAFAIEIKNKLNDIESFVMNNCTPTLN